MYIYMYDLVFGFCLYTYFRLRIFSLLVIFISWLFFFLFILSFFFFRFLVFILL